MEDTAAGETSLDSTLEETGKRSIETAGLLRRSLAALIDAIPMATLWGILTGVISLLGGMALPPSPWNAVDRLIDLVAQKPDWALGAGALGLVVICAWHLLGEQTAGASLGKRVMGLRIETASGHQPSLTRSALVALGRIGSVLTLGLFHLWAFVDAERRTLGDRLSGTWVVREASR